MNAPRALLSSGPFWFFLILFSSSQIFFGFCGASLIAQTHTQTQSRTAAGSLVAAVEEGDLRAVRQMLASGESVDARKTWDGKTAFIRAVEKGYRDIIRALLDAGANINARDNFGNTALIIAARLYDTFIVQDLLARGADPNAQNRDGTTALMIASGAGDSAVAGALLLANADAFARDKSGKTARDYAVQNNHPVLVRVLSDYELARAAPQ